MKIVHHICLRILLLLFLSQNLMASVRTVVSKEDQTILIKTALGIATIVQLPEVVQSAIIGDQSGFKVEYLNKAVTIKPLRFAAKTNLYLLTGQHRYTLRLATQGQDLADYIVYIKDPPAKESVNWRPYSKRVQGEYLTLQVLRVGVTQEGFILIEAKVTSKESIKVVPEQFWVLQAGISKIINGLFLSQTSATKNLPIRVGISIAKTDIEAKQPLIIELRAKETISIQISEVNLWK